MYSECGLVIALSMFPFQDNYLYLQQLLRGQTCCKPALPTTPGKMFLKMSCRRDQGKFCWQELTLLSVFLSPKEVTNEKKHI